MSSAPQRTYRLITNVNDAYINSVRLHAHAILLETPIQMGSIPSEGGRIRGFMTDGALPVFTHYLTCGPLDYERSDPVSSNVLMSDGGALKPLASGEHLKFKDGTVITMVKAISEKSFQIDDYTDIRHVWRDLLPRVADYWPHPAMPMVDHVDVRRARVVHEARQRMFG